MKSNSSTILILQILTSVGALLYLLFVAMTIFYDSYPIFNPFGLNEALLLIFIAGLVLAWANKKLVTGIIFMIWNIIVWLSDLYFNRPDQDYSMFSAIASFFMFIGAFFMLEWFKSNKENLPSPKRQWKFILQVLLVNYVILYAIVVFSEITIGETANYLSFPFLLYPLILLIFLGGFMLSWKKELLAGYIFLLWVAILIYANVAYSEISTLGGWALFGLPILLQGIFYINIQYKFKT